MYLVHKVIHHPILAIRTIKNRRVQWNADVHLNLRNTCRVWNTVLNKDSSTL